MHPGSARVDLSVGYTQGRTGRIVVLVIVGIGLVVACCGLGAITGVLTGGRDAAGVSGVLALVMGGAAAVGMTLLGVNIVRQGARLEGTRLTVTGRRSRSIDLRSAQSVTLHASADSQTSMSSDGSLASTRGTTRTPVLTVHGPGGPVGLRLRSLDGVLIPAPQMIALADALSSTACPGSREAVYWLRTMAADPRTMLL
jgi:hypothetical protein